MNTKTQIRRNSPAFRKGILIGWGTGALVVLVITIVANQLATTKYDNILRQFLKEGPSTVISNKAAEGLDLNYYSSAYSSASVLKSHEADVCTQTGEEGAVLLENKDNSLPLASGTKVSFFSESSVDPVFGGAGSGGSSSADSVSLKDAFTGAGFEVNTDLWNFYSTGAGSSYRRSHVTYYDGGEDWKINECPLSLLESSNVLSSASGTTPIFVFARSAGEGRDLARNMYSWTSNAADQKKHYLEPNSDELATIDYLNKNFSNVIVLANTDNVMELGWIKDYPNVRSVIYMPGVGTTGFKGLANLVAGSADFSGKLVDTIAYDSFSSPAMQNMGDYEWAHSGYYYVNYLEGIYVGYKYYETRYEDTVLGRGNAASGSGVYGGESAWDYALEVQYPFGYGLSYTTFSLSDYTFTDNLDGTLTASVTVTNTGAVSGKEAVGFYTSSPYTDYDIENKVEKSAVELAGIAKTGIIRAGENEKVSATIPLSSLKSYDYTKAKTYILDQGDYYVTAALDAHQAVNNVLLAKKAAGITIDETKMTGTAGNADLTGKYTQASFDDTTYSKDEKTGTSITNQFDYASLADSKYLSRNNWQDTYPEIYGTPSGNVSGYSERANSTDGKGYTYTHEPEEGLLKKLASKDSLNPDTVTDGKARYNESNDLQLIDLKGATYDDKRWDDLIAEMSLNEVGTLIGVSGFRTANADSIGKPTAEDHDGPQGLNDIVSKAIIGYSFTTETLLAQTWNKELAAEVGRCIGEDGLAHSIPGWYAPAMDIHRTPFAGRNFEYYSEDAYLSGTLGKAEIKGAAEKGMYAFVKHFALNDQENHRSGVSTWANEQEIRETNLKAFEIALKNDDMEELHYEQDDQGTYEEVTSKVNAAKAVMTSMNRIGATWAGGNYPLITKVLKEEWGFCGMVETDYTMTTDYMDPTQLIQAGGSCILSTVCPVYKVADADYAFAKEAVKGILYCVANSSAMNGLVHGTTVIRGFPYYRYYLAGIDTVLIAFIVIALLIVVLEILRALRKRRLIEEAHGDRKDASLIYQSKPREKKPSTMEEFNRAYGALYSACPEGIADLLALYSESGEVRKDTAAKFADRYFPLREVFDQAYEAYERLPLKSRLTADKDAADAMKMFKALLRKEIPDRYIAYAVKAKPTKETV